MGGCRGVHEVLTSKIWKAHQVSTVVVPVARDDAGGGGHLHLPQQSRQHVFRHVAVVQNAHVFSLLAFFQSAFHPVHHAARHVVVHVQGGVAGRLEGEGVEGLGFEEAEDDGQCVPDDVFQKHDPVHAVRSGRVRKRSKCRGM